MNLSKKLTFAFVAFGALPTLILSAQIFRGAQTMLDEQGDRLGDRAVDVGDVLDRNMFERYGDVQAFGANAAVRNRASWYEPTEAKNEIVRAMNKYTELYGLYALMIMTDTQGKVVAVNARDAKGAAIDTRAIYGMDLRGEPWFQAVTAGRYTTRQPFASSKNTVANGTVVGEVIEDRIASAAYGRPIRTIGFSAPVYDGQTIIGYWNNRANFDFVGDVLADAHAELGADVTVMLADARGHLLDARGPRAPKGGVSLAEDGFVGVKEAVGGGRGSARAEAKGQDPDLIVGYAHADGAMGYPGTAWSVILSVPSEIAAADAYAAGRLGLGITVATLIFVTLGGLAIGRRISRPVVAMAESAERIAVGDVELAVTHEGNDEIGRLADAFRGLVGYIRASSDAVAALGRGELGVRIETRSEADKLSRGINGVAESVRYFAGELRRVSDAAADGDLSARVAPGPLEGDYRTLATSTSAMLDQILEPVSDATATLERVAACDLTARIERAYKGDHARLCDSLNAAVEGLQTALQHVSRGSEQVKAASGQIAGGSQALAQGASEQASATTETRSMLDEVTETASRNAENAGVARGLTERAVGASSRGAEAMTEMTQAVSRIRAAVVNTAQIMRDINQIAFQTNLLALNAAVEAARAGDAGRGFAVVADEVRNLAQQAKSAAHRTEELLSESVRQAERGEQITQSVTATLLDVTETVKKAEGVVREIAEASGDQAERVQGVQRATAQIDHVTHQNAAGAEELSSTAEQLAAQAQELLAMVSRFRLTEDDPEVTVVPATVRRADELQMF
jgi:methyl-accepting chemotaxis protein